MVTETKVKCVCGSYLEIMNVQHDTTSWAACQQCDRCSKPFDLGTPVNTILEDFNSKYLLEYEPERVEKDANAD